MRYEKGTIQKFRDEWEKKGKEHGERQLPPINAAYDENEDEVFRKANESVAAIEESMSIHLTKFSDQLTNNKYRCKSINVNGKLEDQYVVGELNHLEMKFDQVYAKCKDGIIDAKEKYNKCLGFLNGFKDRNKLEREAKQHKPHIYNFAIVGTVVLLEAVLNAHFHQGEGGLIEGALVAFCISLINVAFGMALGFGFTYKNLIENKKAMVFGWLCLFVFVIEATYLNALFATFRAEYNALLMNPALENISSAASDAFGTAVSKVNLIFQLTWPFKDLLSTITFFITFFFSAIAFREGYVWDDPCPGYGARSRELKMLRDTVEALDVQLDKDLSDACSAAAEPFTKKIDEILPLTPVKLYKLAAELEVMKQNMLCDLDLLNKEIKSVVTAYRDANKKLRGDQMVPELFKQEVKRLGFNNVDNDYQAVIRDINSHAEEMEKGFTALVRELSFISEHFKMKAEKLKTEKREQYRRDISNTAAIKAAHTANNLLVKGAA